MVRGRPLKDRARDIAALAQTVSRAVVSCETDGWFKEPTPGAVVSASIKTGDVALSHLQALERAVSSLRADVQDFLANSTLRPS